MLEKEARHSEDPTAWLWQTEDHEALGDVDLVGFSPNTATDFLCDLEQSAFTPSETQFPHL